MSVFECDVDELVFFFFKQKTAYEMRISDWSSDVCSSDLFYTWLHRIAVNTAKNHLVAHKRRPPTEDIDVSDAEQFDSGIRLRDTDTPDRELARQQMEQTVMRAVDALPEELRTAITLRSEEHTSELQSLMRISYDVFCLHKT